MGAAHRRGADLGRECEISLVSPLGRPVDLGTILGFLAKV
jgi:hypothetical protein